MSSVCCPQCGCNDHGVSETHADGPSQSIWRIRKCKECGHRFNTFERTAESIDLLIRSCDKRLSA